MIDKLLEGTTFGMEFDCGEFDRRKPLPAPHTWCDDEVGSHSLAGVGADPTLRDNLFGGEVQFAPQTSEADLWREVMKVLSATLRSEIYFPGTIHMHVRVPGLLQRPDLIKKLVMWTQDWWPRFAPIVFQSEEHQPNQGAYNDWLYDCTYECKTLVYPKESLVRMMNPAVDTAEKIALALHDNPTQWKNEWYWPAPEGYVKRPAVNFGHLALNETIEFRGFIATQDPVCLKDIIEFPLQFLEMGLRADGDPLRITRGKRYQTHPYNVPQFNGIAEMTTGYVTNRSWQPIANALINKLITIEDLGCPEYWIRRGYQ